MLILANVVVLVLCTLMSFCNVVANWWPYINKQLCYIPLVTSLGYSSSLVSDELGKIEVIWLNTSILFS